MLLACGAKEEPPAPEPAAEVTGAATEAANGNAASAMGAAAPIGRGGAPAELERIAHGAVEPPRVLTPQERRRTQREATAAFGAENFAVAFEKYRLLAESVRSDPRLFCKAGFAAKRAGDTENARTYLFRGVALHARTLSGDAEVRRGRAMCLYNFARLIEESDPAGARQALSESLRLRDNRTVRAKLEALGGEPDAPLVGGDLGEGSRVELHADGNVRVAFAQYEDDGEAVQIGGEVLFQIKEGARWRTQVIGMSIDSSRERDAAESLNHGTSIALSSGGRDFIAVRWSSESEWFDSMMDEEPEVETRDGITCMTYDETHYTTTTEYLALCPVDGRDRCRRMIVGDNSWSKVTPSCDNDGDPPAWANAEETRSRWKVAFEFEGEDVKLRVVYGTAPDYLRHDSIPLSRMFANTPPAPRPIAPWTGDLASEREGLRR